MTLKDISNVISSATDIIICQMKSNKLSYDEFKWLVEKSDSIAYMLVEDIFNKDNNLYICIY